MWYKSSYQLNRQSVRKSQHILNDLSNHPSNLIIVATATKRHTHTQKKIFTESTYGIVKEMKFLLVLKNLSIVEIAAPQKVMLITQKVMLRLVLPT